MKYRESGMPEEKMWETFFHPTEILSKMSVDDQVNIFLDVGCGYGTFLLPASKIIRNRAIGIDIDNEMIKKCQEYSRRDKLTKTEFLLGDMSSVETQEALEKDRNSIDYVALFNILHCEDPVALLKEAGRILNRTGKIGVIHWKYEDTPRGPSMEIRPTPDHIITWASKAGLYLERQIDLPPYHFGLIFRK